MDMTKQDKQWIWRNRTNSGYDQTGQTADLTKQDKQRIWPNRTRGTGRNRWNSRNQVKQWDRKHEANRSRGSWVMIRQQTNYKQNYYLIYLDVHLEIFSLEVVLSKIMMCFSVIMCNWVYYTIVSVEVILPCYRHSISLVQNRQQTHDWTLIGSGAIGLGIQEWDCILKTLCINT